MASNESKTGSRPTANGSDSVDINRLTECERVQADREEALGKACERLAESLAGYGRAQADYARDPNDATKRTLIDARDEVTLAEATHKHAREDRDAARAALEHARLEAGANPIREALHSADEALAMVDRHRAQLEAEAEAEAALCASFLIRYCFGRMYTRMQSAEELDALEGVTRGQMSESERALAALGGDYEEEASRRSEARSVRDGERMSRLATASEATRLLMPYARFWNASDLLTLAAKDVAQRIRESRTKALKSSRTPDTVSPKFFDALLAYAQFEDLGSGNDEDPNGEAWRALAEKMSKKLDESGIFGWGLHRGNDHGTPPLVTYKEMVGLMLAHGYKYKVIEERDRLHAERMNDPACSSSVRGRAESEAP
jgi:hypothetical protein